MGSILRLLRLTRPYLSRYAVAIVALAAGTGLFLLIPQKLGRFVEALSAGRPELPMATAGQMGLILVAQALLGAVYSYIISLTAEQIGNQLRRNFFANLLREGMQRLGRRHSGVTASEFASDLAVIQSGLSDTLVNFLRHAVFTVGALTFMFAVDAQLTLAALGSVCAAAILFYVFIRITTRASVKVQAARAEIVGVLLEAGNNALVIKSYGREHWFQGRFGAKLDIAYREIVRHTKLTVLVNPVVSAVLIVAILFVLFLGTNRIGAGAMSVADLVAIVTYAVVLVSAISQLGVTLGRLQQSAAMFAKHAELLDAPDFERGTSERVGSADQGPLELRAHNVRFTYFGSSKPVLRGVSVEIPAGKITALVGSSGTGKSSLIGILAGLLEPDSGGVEVGDGNWPPAVGEIALVPQQPFLFSGTVIDNIALGRPGIDLAQVRKAAQQAQIDEFIETLPDGYSTQLLEGGRNLSRGQQQRLALARALAGNPRLIILDEATASLDVLSERAIIRSLNALRGSVTIIVVAHQGAMLSNVDQIIQLDGGEVRFAGDPSDFAGLSSLIAPASEPPALTVAG